MEQSEYFQLSEEYRLLKNELRVCPFDEVDGKVARMKEIKNILDATDAANPRSTADVKKYMR